MHSYFLSYDQPDLIFRDGSLPVNARQVVDVSLVPCQMLPGFVGSEIVMYCSRPFGAKSNVQFALVSLWALVVAYPGLVPET